MRSLGSFIVSDVASSAHIVNTSRDPIMRTGRCTDELVGVDMQPDIYTLQLSTVEPMTVL